VCGIVGIGGNFPKSQCIDIISQMMKSIAHRGPDDEGMWAGNGFGLGMRRLSIIDISGGHQPMSDELSGTIIVYNGELYNYKDIRKELEGKGVLFKTQSDTEVILKSLVQKGLDAVNQWNGMFALAIWNPVRKQLLLIRDRLGIKPIYYAWNGKILLFASEIKAILASGLYPKKVNLQAVWDYLTFRYIPDPETVWEGIWKLPPGHILEWSPDKEPVLRGYWTTDVIADSEEDEDSEGSLKAFESIFLDAVNIRLVASDVPVGVLLSGGLDSSSVAAAAVELGHRNFHTFSVGFADGGEYSELPYAHQMAKHIGSKHHEVIIDRKDFLDLLPAVVQAADEPLADLASVPLLAVCRLAREHVKVVLSGEGGDEVLAGYSLDRMVRIWQTIMILQQVPSPLLKFLVGIGEQILPRKYGTFASQVAEIPISEWNRRRRTHMTRYFSQEEKMVLWPSYRGEDSERILETLYAGAASSKPLQQLLSVYQRSWLVEDLLMKADKMSMATSLELRVPFLDYRLVTWANRQPDHVKVRQYSWFRYTTKDVLRRFASNRVPRNILIRAKRGFPVPSYDWLRMGLASWAEDHLTQNNSHLQGVFNTGAIRKIIKQAERGDLRVAHRVWLLLILEIWLEEWGADLG
jgi:asparagine synthase (glutamine-hydrolysing)